MGFEPTTFCLGSKHSTTELRPQKSGFPNPKKSQKLNTILPRGRVGSPRRSCQSQTSLSVQHLRTTGAISCKRTEGHGGGGSKTAVGPVVAYLWRSYLPSWFRLTSHIPNNLANHAAAMGPPLASRPSSPIGFVTALMVMLFGDVAKPGSHRFHGTPV